MIRSVVLALTLPMAAAAQGAPDLPAELPAEIAGSEAMASAARAILDAGVDEILIGDLIGTTIEGPEGEALGTVENLVAVPGGRLVAALMTLEDGTRIAVPYQALKLSGAAEALEATLPVSADELRAMGELEDLAARLGG